MSLVKLITYAPPISIIIFLTVQQNLSTSYTLMLFFIVAISIAVSLVYALRITATINKIMTHAGFMRAHILLHIVPAAYMFALLFLTVSAIESIIFLALMLLFFWTGRKTWQSLHNAFGSKLYYIFFRGNTGVLAVSPVLFGLDRFSPSISGGQAFPQALTVYFIIHFSLVGVAVQTIKKDLESVKGQPFYPTKP